jgi:hypothetical protein
VGMSTDRHRGWRPEVVGARREQAMAREDETDRRATRLAAPAGPQPSHASERHLRALAAPRPRKCRIVGCRLPGAAPRGFCTPCDAVYLAACTLRERLIARSSARLQAARPQLFQYMPREARERLLSHIAAHNANLHQHPSVLELAGLEDFLLELHELDELQEQP